jgi:cardiolipin synthase
VNLPNFFTFLRIALIPVFGLLWLRGRPGPALLVFAAAGLTDLLDGFLARTLHQRTRLGQLLDPAADKLTLLVAFLVAAASGALPWWLAALVIGRDVILSLGAALFAFVVHGRLEPSRWTPTRLGKYSTFFQLGTIGLALAAHAAEADALRPWVAAMTLDTAALTSISAIQYISTAVRALGRPPTTQGAAT